MKIFAGFDVAVGNPFLVRGLEHVGDRDTQL
jgi:hypothetical protein